MCEYAKYLIFLIIFINGEFVTTKESIRSKIARFINQIPSSSAINLSNQTQHHLKSNGGVQFILYNRLVPQGQAISKPKELNNKNFLHGAPIKFITHGWLSDVNMQSAQILKDSYLNHTKTNIFVVDWDQLSRSILYPLIVPKLEAMSKDFAHFLKELLRVKKINPKNVHLVGHSLGAHLSGMVGKKLIKESITIGRITGLDPAGPGFRKGKPNTLSSSDAKFVDVIHTSMGALGISKSLGHADFYPNGGSCPMPGCNKLLFLLTEACSHSKSWEYFAESVYNRFLARQCNSFDSFEKKKCARKIVAFGEHAPPSARGKFYLVTRAEPPYSLGE